MKRIPAIVAAFVITVCLGAAILAVGANALFNPRPAAAAADSSSQEGAAAQVEQLQALVGQYQQREQQYQAELSQASQEIQQAGEQIQQYQNLLQAMQERGLIRIDRNGRIYLPGRFGDGD